MIRSKFSSPKLSIGLGLLIFVVMGPALWAPFVYDDVALILQNPDVIAPWQGLRHFFLESFAPQEAYEPVVVAVHRLLFFLSGGAPLWYRLTSLLFHWINCALLLLLLRELIKPPHAAFLLAALFAVYPAHTEALAVSTFKKHLIVAMCGLLMLHLERPWREEKASLGRRAAAFFCLTLALLTKEHGLILAPIVMTMSLALAPDWKARLRRDRIFYAGLFAAGLFLIWWRAKIVPRAVSNIIGENLALHLLTSAKILLWYLRELALPWQLSQEHWLPPVSRALSWETAGILSALAACAAALAALWRRDRVAFAGLAMALLWLTPCLNIFPYLNISLVANRYLYLAFAGILLCAGRLLAPVWAIKFKGLSAAFLVWAAVALTYTGLAMRNLACYSDPVDLWTRAVQCAPQHARAHVNLAAALAARMRWADAEREYRQACRFGRGIAVSARASLAEVLAERGDLHHAALLAEGILREGTKYDNNARMTRLLGACLLRQGASKKAGETLARALALNPYDASSRLNLGLYYDAVGQSKRAEIQWNAAKALPESRTAALRLLARLYAKTNRLEKSRKTYEDLLAEQPLQLDAVKELAALYARAGRREQGRVLFDALIAGIQSRETAMRKVPEELSPAESRSARKFLSAAYDARAAFLRRLD